MKYDGFKEIQRMVVIPEKSGIVALIDVDKVIVPIFRPYLLVSLNVQCPKLLEG